MNCVLLYWRHHSAQLLYNDFGYKEKTLIYHVIYQVKANLRSVLDSEDEELEIIPHIKGSTDFEIYDQVVIKPTFTVLPWDDNVKPNYTLNYKVSYKFHKIFLQLQFLLNTL